MEGRKMVLKNTCEGVHLLVKLQAITLQACKPFSDIFFKNFS